MIFEGEFGKSENKKSILYPPYHSKYNPIERVWGVLENHWRGETFDSIEKTLGLARTMKWKGKNPTVEFIKGIYAKGVNSPKKQWNNWKRVLTESLVLKNGLFLKIFEIV